VSSRIYGRVKTSRKTHTWTLVPQSRIGIDLRRETSTYVRHNRPYRPTSASAEIREADRSRASGPPMPGEHRDCERPARRGISKSEGRKYPNSTGQRAKSVARWFAARNRQLIHCRGGSNWFESLIGAWRYIRDGQANSYRSASKLFVTVCQWVGPDGICL
jgi:hypothetical protein